MLYQLHKFDRSTHFILACSGGVDSMAIADFYKRGGKNFTIAYFNHATPLASVMQDFTCSWALANGVPYKSSTISVKRGKRQSKEEFWRDQRYSWLRSFNKPIVTCHHLNDAIEGYIFSALNGNPKIIKHYNDDVYRPFLTNTKQDLIDWCVNHNVSWLEDSSNKDVAYPRNRIRHNIIPEAMMINPGLAKVIKRKILNKI